MLLIANNSTTIINVFYDTARSHCACMAFGIEVDGGPMHAHFLDWEAKSEILSRNAIDYVSPMCPVQTVTAKYPDHVHHVDPTVVPTSLLVFPRQE